MAMEGLCVYLLIVLLVLLIAVIKVKFHFKGLPVIILYHHDKILRFAALRGIVQPELLVFEQVAVVRLEDDAVFRFQRARSLVLEETDGVYSAGIRTLFFSSQRISTVSPLATLFGTGMVSTVNG